MNRIREIRESKGIKQKELAIAIDVSRPTVSEWESGKKDPSGERLKKLAQYFNVDELTVLGAGRAESPEEDDVMRYRECLRRDPNYRILFDASARVRPEHLEAAAAMLQALGPNDD